jgi:hypothetical protein
LFLYGLSRTDRQFGYVERVFMVLIVYIHTFLHGISSDRPSSALFASSGSLKPRITLKNKNAPPHTMALSRRFDNAVTQQPNNASAKNGECRGIRMQQYNYYCYNYSRTPPILSVVKWRHQLYFPVCVGSELQSRVGCGGFLYRIRFWRSVSHWNRFPCHRTRLRLLKSR